MISTKNLTPSEKKEYQALRLVYRHLAISGYKRLDELAAKMVAGAPRKASTGLTGSRKPMRRVSTKQAKINAEYTELRKQFLMDSPLCECERCGGGLKAEQVHHRLRRGKYMLDTSTWMAVSAECHEYIELNPTWSRAKGYILT